MISCIKKPKSLIIVFDLDDTLYDEATFVHSGMHAVADYLAEELHENSKDIFKQLLLQLNISRDHVFNRYLRVKGIESKKLIQKCISIYRGHEPKISLFPSALTCLKRLKNHPLYVVTDGNKLVQKRKFLTLGLKSFVRDCLCTYAHGVSKSKPSPYCFQKICKLENSSPSNIVYIADNPYKDFVELKPLGFKTIRVLQGVYKNIRLEPAYEADLTIKSLDEINESLLQGV